MQPSSRAQAQRGKQEPLAFGMVFPFSTHAYLLRHWLRLGEIDPDRDVNLVGRAAALYGGKFAHGLLNGFCVGSPWNSLAVDADAGLHRRAGRRHRPTRAGEDSRRARRQLRSGIPISFSAHTRLCARRPAGARMRRTTQTSPRLLASRATISGFPSTSSATSLDGDLAHRRRRASKRADADFLVFGRDTTNRPDPRHAKWLYAEMVGAGQTPFSEDASLSRRCRRLPARAL